MTEWTFAPIARPWIRTLQRLAPRWKADRPRADRTGFVPGISAGPTPPITLDSSFRSLRRLPQLAPVSDWFVYSPLLPMKLGVWFGTLRSAERRGSVPGADAVRQGLQRMVDLTDAGVQLGHDLYTAAEKRANPGKAQTKLFHFPAAPGARFAIVCAGGAYAGVGSLVEGFPVAARLNALGYHAFVLSYRVLREARFPQPADDLAAAVRFVLDRADEFGVDPDHYAVAGFSAGGHLAGAWGTRHLGHARYGLPSPGALLLGYPALALSRADDGRGRHLERFFFRNLLGRGYSQADKNRVDVVLHVHPEYPPTYLWHCRDDTTVPVAGAELMVDALTAHGVPHQFRVAERGGHGIGLGDATDASGWLDEAVAFWRTARETAPGT